MFSTSTGQFCLSTASRICAAVTLVLGFGLVTGCSGLRVPSADSLSGNPLFSGSFLPHKVKPGFVDSSGSSMSGAMPMSANSVAQQVYQGTKQAKANHGIVLEVVGDESPVRVLPLPEDGRSVYVSQLLTQSGVQKQLGSVRATLFRHSTESIGGMPMECKMSKDGESVRPECDYALQPGDRLRVEKNSLLGSADLINLLLAR